MSKNVPHYIFELIVLLDYSFTFFETVDKFCSALKMLAKNSGLSDKEESWITLMLVLGLKDQGSKERLIERDQNLERTLQAAHIFETSKQHMKGLKDESRKVERVDALGRKGPKPKGGMTYRSCGTLHAPDSCPAAGRRCHKCKRMNHFARMCSTPGEQRRQVNVVELIWRNLKEICSLPSCAQQ